MAYIVGLVTKEEQEELEKRGWELEDPPEGLIDEALESDAYKIRMIFVDSSLFDIMNGPDWEKEHV